MLRQVKAEAFNIQGQADMDKKALYGHIYEVMYSPP